MSTDRIEESRHLAASLLRRVADDLDTEAGRLKTGASRAETNGDNRSNIQARLCMAEAFTSAAIQVALRAAELSVRLVAPQRRTVHGPAQLDLLTMSGEAV